MRFLIIKILLILVYLGVGFQIYAQCEGCEKSLEDLHKMAELLANQKRDLAIKNSNLEKTLESLKLKLTDTQNLQVVLNEVRQSNDENLQIIEEKIKEINLLLSENQNLIQESANLKARNIKLVKEKQNLELIKSKQEEEIKALKENILDLKGVISKLESELNVLKNIIYCIQEFNENLMVQRQQARADLESANNRFEEIKYKFNPLKFDTSFQEEVRAIWSVYARFTVNCQEVICGPYILSVCDDYKTAEEHLNSAYILSGNMGNIIDQFGSTLSDKLNTMNELLLSELGQAIAKGDYNIRSESRRIVENLPSLLISERKGKKVQIDTSQLSSGISSEIVSSLRSIKTEFYKKNYSESAAIFSRYYRFFELAEIRSQREIVAEAKYCVGVILLWDLFDINRFSGMTIPSSWLDLTLADIRTQRSTGRQLLLEISRQEGISDKLRAKAYLALAKTY
jgi:DNA repair exonuclease SbcCD ATPase subunit